MLVRPIRPERPRRRGAALVEAAIVLPVLFLLMLGLIVGSMGVFHYQQVAMLAREGARYASVRGGQYQQETAQPAATQATIHSQAVLPTAGGLDTAHLTTTAAWDNRSAIYGPMPIYLDTATNVWRRNHVAVTVRYAWNPLTIFPAMTLSSTSVMPLTY